MTDENSIKSTAYTLIQQYGEDAAVIAVMRAAEFAAAGDVQSLAYWDGVIAYLEAVDAGEVTGDSTIN